MHLLAAVFRLCQFPQASCRQSAGEFFVELPVLFLHGVPIFALHSEINCPDLLGVVEGMLEPISLSSQGELIRPFPDHRARVGLLVEIGPIFTATLSSTWGISTAHL